MPYQKQMELGAIILSGGKSSRFGADKGLYHFKGKELIQYAIDICKAFTSEIIIIADNHDYTKFGFPIFADIYPNSGPMGGIHSGLFNSKSQLNIVLSCDTPFVDKQLLQMMIDKYSDEEVCIAQTPDGKYQPLIGLYRNEIASDLEEELKQNHFKMIHFIKQRKHQFFDIPNEHSFNKSFINFNYLSEAQRYEY